MKWIGITGSMGSGKSTVSEELRRRGFVVLDADQVVRTVLRPGGEAESEIFRTFGEGVRGADGSLDRRALGALVFGNPSQLEKLEWITHPRVRSEVARERAALVARGEVVAFYDVPLLFEKKMEDTFDFIFCVSAPPALRLTRLQARTGLTVQEIEARWSAQLPAQYKESRSSAVIRNTGTLDELAVEVTAALKKVGVPERAHLP